jgi:hypothetical protein
VLAHVVEKWTTSAIFSKTSGSPGAFGNSDGGTFNNSTPTSVALGPLPTGSPYISGNNIMYFHGLTQVKDPSIALMPSSLQSQSSLYAIAGPSGNILLENPVAGQLGPLSPTNFRGLGSYSFNVQVSKPVVLNRERNIQAIFRADFINILNKPIWSTPTTNIDSTSFGLITSASGNRSVNVTLRVTF